jgi:hypothetical protein
MNWLYHNNYRRDGISTVKVFVARIGIINPNQGSWGHLRLSEDCNSKQPTVNFFLNLSNGIINNTL